MKSIECFWIRFPLKRAATNTVFLSLLVLAGIGSMAMAAEIPSQADKAKLASEVKVLFRNKCAKCHGPVGVRETEKPKGEMDYILDLAKLSSNPKIIVPGDPNESKLFNMVEDLIMPDDQAGEDPLPEKEIALIRLWILAGAPSE